MFKLFPVIILFTMLTLTSEVNAQALPSAVHPCEANNGLSYICGPIAAEDIVRLPDSHWLISSGLNIGEAAHLYLIDTRTNKASYLSPDAEGNFQVASQGPSYCRNPPDPQRFSFSGLGLVKKDDNSIFLMAVNDGDRKAVEIFRVENLTSRPSLKWVSCLPVPDGSLPNSVVPLSDGRVLVSSFYNPDEPESEWQRMEKGEGTGKVLLWEQGHFIELPIGSISGANGLAISKDEKTVYVSAWSAGELIIYTLSDGKRRNINLNFLPDNITVQYDGRLLIAGQKTSVKSIAECSGPECPQDWVVATIDVLNDEVTLLLEREGSALINYATAAIELNGVLYITARGDRRLALFEMQGE